MSERSRTSRRAARRAARILRDGSVPPWQRSAARTVLEGTAGGRRERRRRRRRREALDDSAGDCDDER